jgi:hypothetical protein
MDWPAQTQPLWEHTCCETRYWSAARMCDRCGAQAAFVVVGVSTTDAMARLHSLEQRPLEMKSAPCLHASAVLPESPGINPDEQVPFAKRRDSEGSSRLPLHPDLERALVFGLWLLSGLVCVFMVIGAVVEFEGGNYARSLTCGISAAAAPTSVIAFAIEGWLKHCRSKTQRG